MFKKTIERPTMTFPEAEANWVREAYAEANVILEYGSGGSTVMGGDLSGKTIFSVENARPWLRMMKGWFKKNPPKSKVLLHDGFVGDTRNWGYPKNHDKLNLWPHYPLDIWGSEGFVQPDLVLIDGRFRVGCFLATLFRTKAPVTVLYDDYTNRPRYSVVEEFAPIVETRGRMVRFELKPTPFPVEDMARIMELMLRTQ